MKEYITDTIALRGKKTINFETNTASKIAQINYESLTAGKEGFLTPNALTIQTTSTEEDGPFMPIATTTISLGGFVDSESEIISFGETTANKIKLYTGEILSEGMVAFYPGQERFTVDKRGHVGINSPDIDRDRATIDVRPTIGMPVDPKFPTRLETPSVAITHPYYNQEGSRFPTPQYIGNLQFRSIQDPPKLGQVSFPIVMAAIQVETDGQSDVYGDPRVNMTFNTNTGDGEGRPEPVKHLEINGYEKKTKIFTQLNLGNVPVFRDQEEAVKLGGLVNGDVYQDRLQNLKIVFLEQEEV